MDLYTTKTTDYFTQVRTDLVSLLPRNPGQRVLEIGAGGGDTLLYIKQNGLAAEVVGQDIFSLPNTHQTHPQIDRFVIGNIETDPLPYPAAYFNVVLCGDVIEHLADPWAAIKALTVYLRPGGQLIISTPNFRSLKNFWAIFVLGDFRYDPAGGLLDKTHLRFFCRKNIIDLVQTNELLFRHIQSINDFPAYRFRWPIRLFNLLTMKRFEEFLTNQYVVVGERRG